jgi:integrase
MTALALPATHDLVATVEQAEAYARGARSEATRTAYAADLADFQRFCRSAGLVQLPATPQTVTLYVTALAQRGAKIATIRRRLVGISIAHKDRGLDSPTAHAVVRAVVKGIANAIGSAPTRKAALTNDLLPATLLAAGETLKGIRDRAIVLLGFSAALRRSEIAALDVRDLRFDRQGLVVTLRRSKTDQEGIGREIGLPFVELEQLCAARAVRRWLDAAGIDAGPVFRAFSAQHALRETPIAGRDVARLLKRLTGRAGLAGDFGGHSLRAGFVTSAAAKGVPEIRIMETTGHKSVAILRGYVRRATVFEGSPLRSIFAAA